MFSLGLSAILTSAVPLVALRRTRVLGAGLLLLGSYGLVLSLEGARD